MLMRRVEKWRRAPPDAIDAAERRSPAKIAAFLIFLSTKSKSIVCATIQGNKHALFPSPSTPSAELLDEWPSRSDVGGKNELAVD